MNGFVAQLGHTITRGIKMATKFYIVQDSPKNPGKCVFMADRNLTPNKWWTFDVFWAVSFYTKSKADNICDKLKFNNPRVVPYIEAQRIHDNNKLI